MTHTQRTLKYLRELGYIVGITERIIPSKPFTKRIDLFGFIDIEAFDNNMIIGIQSCGTSFTSHNDKILKNENAKKWINGEKRHIWLIGWRKVKQKRGAKRMIYKPRIKIYSKDDFK